jgi:hypothetical protein
MMAAAVTRVALAAVLAGSMLSMPMRLNAQEVLLQEGREDSDAGTFTVPFAFYSGSLGPAVGASIGSRGLFQPQASAFATVVGSANGSAYGFLAYRDVKVAFSDRLLVNGQLNVGKFGQIDLYVDGNPEFSGERAGSNGSDPDNYLQGDGTDVKYWNTFGYVLPIGAGAVDPTSTLTLRDGIVIKGGRDTSVWNPFESGLTIVGIKPFYRNQDASTDEAGDRKVVTAGSEYLLHYENTDFHDNPSRGSVQQVRYSQDWGGFGSTAPWQTIDFTASKYFTLSPGAKCRQRVLALNLWVIDTPSWNDADLEDGAKVYHRPPSYAGATLGGLERMRGYAEGRFNDRSAVYYAAEYRHIPDWNPLRDIGWLDRRNARVQWLQYVVGTEIGRVADEFDPEELHTDMKVTGLLGLRAMVNTLIVRADIGLSAEGAGVQMTIDQPF